MLGGTVVPVGVGEIVVVVGGGGGGGGGGESPLN